MIVFMQIVAAIMAAQVAASRPRIDVERFRSFDVATRRQIMGPIAAAPDAQGTDVLPLIEVALQDPDSRIRFLAASALSQLFMRISSGRGVPNDPRTRPALPGILLAALNDSDFRIRGVAVSGLASVGALSAATTRATLISMYRSESDASVRNVIIHRLGLQALDSPEVQGLAISALEVTHRLSLDALLR
jgi:hypothetical protein